MRKPLLLLEAILLLGPVTGVLCYTTLLVLIIGLPAAITQAFVANAAFDSFLPLAVIGNIAGDYAVILLGHLVIHTLRGRRIAMGTWFRTGIAAALIAAICAVIIYGWLAMMLIALPPTILAIHFGWLQRAIGTGNPLPPALSVPETPYHHG